jgi:hypothetical protein
LVKCKHGYTFRNSVFFCSYVNGLTQLYPELYDSDAGGVPTQHQANFGKKWKSYASIIELANGDIRAIDEIINQPLEKCLLLLAYKADKSFLETLIHKESLKGIK